MIQLNMAWAPEGDCAKVWAGSHVQDLGLEVQFVETVERKVVKVQEPTGKGPVGAVAFADDVPFEDAGAELAEK